MYSIKGGSKSNKPRPKSQFHLVANTNISSRQYSEFTPEKKRNFINTMKGFAEYLKENFRDYLKAPVPSERKSVKMEDIQINIEIQENPKSAGLLHLDGVIFFNKYALWDFDKLNPLWNSFIRHAGGKKGIINMPFMPNYANNAKQYSEKQGMRLI